MFGDIDAWFFRALAGINPDAAAPGFKHFFVTPNVVGDLTWARADYNSVRGQIVSAWKVAGGEFQLELKVPANTTATVSLPISDVASAKEGGKSASHSAGVKFLKTDGQRTVFLVASGHYSFAGPLAAH
jgi:alpha-L-rhamnosidase